MTVRLLLPTFQVWTNDRLIRLYANNSFYCSKSSSLNLQEEVTLHGTGPVNLDIQLRAFWRSQGLGYKSHRARILLTGATGFLGAFLLRDLLLHTKVSAIVTGVVSTFKFMYRTIIKLDLHYYVTAECNI